MDNIFEKKYMTKSWSLGMNDHTYRKFVVDDTVKKFYSYLKGKGFTKNKGSRTFLDIGCGNGKNAIYFADRGFKALGVDFAPTAIKLCKENAKREKSKAKFKVADVVADKFDNKFFARTGFGKDKFDVVLDGGCLHHIRRKYWKAYRANILRSVKKGGYYYLHGFSVNSQKFGFIPKRRNWDLKRGHYVCFFTKKEIEDFFGKYFTIVRSYEFPNVSKRFIIRAFWMKRK